MFELVDVGAAIVLVLTTLAVLQVVHAADHDPVERPRAPRRDPRPEPAVLRKAA